MFYLLQYLLWMYVDLHFLFLVCFQCLFHAVFLLLIVTFLIFKNLLNFYTMTIVPKPPEYRLYFCFSSQAFFRVQMTTINV